MELKYSFTYDVLFKLLFVKHPDLLERLITAILGIAVEEISDFKITNPEIPPAVIGDKFCRLDIAMDLNGKKIDLEVQVEDEGDYRERTLYYWSRMYSSALKAGMPYRLLPRIIVISIVDFLMFDCAEYRSEFKLFEVNRHALLSDKMTLMYFEVRKLPKVIDTESELELLLSLFRVKTEEELKQLEELEAPIVSHAIEAYREVVVSPEFLELERLRAEATNNEASALLHAAEVERKKWQGELADMRAALADKDTALADKDTALADKDTALADKDTALDDMRTALDDKDTALDDMRTALDDKDAEIMRLRALLP